VIKGLERGVGQVDPEDVNTGPIELPDHLHGQRRWPKRAQDLRFHCPPSQVRNNHYRQYRQWVTACPAQPLDRRQENSARS
jgi:hypothetical protein